MSFIATTPIEDAEDAVREMYERQQGAWGYVPNYAKSFSPRPGVMARWGQLLAEIRRPLDNRLFEMVTFAAAHELKHTSCSLAHGKQLTEFFSNDEILAIAEQRSTAAVSEAEEEAMRFARKVAHDASLVEAADVERLKGHGYTDAEVFDFAAAAAGRAFFTKLLDAVGSLPDAGLLSIDEDLRVPLTVGRAIETTDVEVMNIDK